MKYIRHLRLFILGLSAMMFTGMYGSTLTQSVPIHRTYNPDDLHISSFSSPTGTNYLKLEWEGMHQETTPGSPMLPFDIMRVEVPLNATGFSITSIEGRLAQTIMLNGPIWPAQQPILTNDNSEIPFTYPDPAMYESFNGPRIEIGETAVLARTKKLLNLRIYPYSIAHNHSMGLYGNIDFEINFEIGDSISTGNANDTIREITPETVKHFTTKFNNISTYIIVTPQAFNSSLKRLKNWKAQKGYDVKVVTLEEIFSHVEYLYSTVDKAEGLRKYLKDQFDIYGPYFCLLVGDENANVPIRKIIYSNDHIAPISLTNNDKLTPTDIYFSDLTENWPLTYEPITETWSCEDTQIYFGRKHDYSPDIIVGRLLCSTSEQIENYIDKLILYEANPGLDDNEYLTNVNFFKSEAPDISAFPYSRWEDNTNAKYHQFNIVNFDSAQYVLREMAQAGINIWHGHGLPYSIAWSSNDYTTSLDRIQGKDTITGDPGDIDAELKNAELNGLDNLNNRWKPSIVYSTSCHHAIFDILYFDTYTFDPMYSMAEVFTMGKHFGGPGFLGNSRSGEGQGSSNMEGEFVEQLQYNAKIGIAETLSKYFCTGFGNTTYIKNAQNLIGEPEFEIWMDKPLNHSFSPNHGNLNAIFQCNLDGWKVIVSDGADGQSTIINNGKYIPTFNGTLLQKDYVISAWKTGYLPFIHYYGINSSLTNEDKIISVRSASLGCYGNADIEAIPFIVGNNATLKIDALDQINSSKDFIIRDGGKVKMLCFGPADLGGTKVESNSALDVQSREITLGKGFSVKKGATFRAALVNVND